MFMRDSNRSKNTRIFGAQRKFLSYKPALPMNCTLTSPLPSPLPRRERRGGNVVSRRVFKAGGADVSMRTPPDEGKTGARSLVIV